MTALYLHLPFCQAKCHYCDFAAFAGRDREIPRYLFALTKEIETHRGKTIETFFAGGGTPTVLSAEQWRALMDTLRRNFIWTENAEATVECNPESTTPEKLAAFRAIGINRLSFGFQAAQPRLLKSLGRLHDLERFLQAFRDARAAGFDNLNIDLMFGLPGQTIADWRETLQLVSDLDPEHISAYALKVEEDTIFDRRGVSTDDDLQADMYDSAADFLESKGYVHYEISNFSKPGRECLHNLRYWRNQSYVGVGVGAAGYENGRRYKNTEDLGEYLHAMEQDSSPVMEEESLAADARVGEDLMLALRLREGARVSAEARRLYGPTLDRFQSMGFLSFNPANETLTATRRGWLLSNQLFQELV